MVHYLVSQCSTEMPCLMQQNVLQRQSQQCEEDLSSSSSAHHFWHLTPRHLKFLEMPLVLSMLYAMCKHKTGVRNNALLCSVFPLQNVENRICSCGTERSLAGTGRCYIGARGSLSPGNEHSKTLVIARFGNSKIHGLTIWNLGKGT